MKFARFFVAAMVLLFARPTFASHDQWHLMTPQESATEVSGVDHGRETLTEKTLRDNEAFFFYLINNSHPPSVRTYGLLESTETFTFTAVKFNNGTLKLAYGDSISFNQATFCVRGWPGTIVPFPVTKKVFSKKRVKPTRVESASDADYIYYRFKTETMINAHDYSLACVEPPAGVLVEYVRSYDISPEMRKTIRRWYWEKVGDTGRLAQSY